MHEWEKASKNELSKERHFIRVKSSRKEGRKEGKVRSLDTSFRMRDMELGCSEAHAVVICRLPTRTLCICIFFSNISILHIGFTGRRKIGRIR